MRIQHNITAMNSYRNYNANSSSLSKNLEKLSSGYKINRAGDDAAGLAISEKMRAQITGLEGATKNAKDGISLIQTAEGALTEVHSMLNRMTTLAEQSANGTYDNDVDRKQLQKEVEALKSEIDRVADSTNFNGLKLLDGSLSDKFETVTTKESAISAITEGAYTANGKTGSFQIDSESVVERPIAEANQTNAKFSVKLNAASFDGVGASDTITLRIGSKQISLTAGAVDLDDPAALADAFVKAGDSGYRVLTKKPSSGDPAAVELTELQDTGSTITEDDLKIDKRGGDADAAAWAEFFNTETGASHTLSAAELEALGADSTKATSITGGGQVVYWEKGAIQNDTTYVQLDDGHVYSMKRNDTDHSVIDFEQVDQMAANSPKVKPDFSVTLSTTSTDGKVTQQPQPQVTLTETGKSAGTSQQARANVNIDFSQLKDGDKLVAGDKTYVFAIGEGSSYKTSALNAGEVRVDLSGIFKGASDLTDSDKQEEAMVKMTKDMGDGNSAAWTIGNKGVTGGVGTLTFQSLSTYDEENAPVKIGGSTTTDDVRMDSTSNIVKQFYATSQEAAASTSFELDVTKIKSGDTFTIDGKTFEFTDGGEVNGKGNVAIDLSDLGVSSGLLDGQKGDVIEKMKTAINGALTITDGAGTQQPKYTISSEGNKVTLTSNDDKATLTTFENRVSAKIDLPTETKNGEGLVLQIGDTAESYNKLTVSIEDMHSAALGIGEINISTQEGAAAALNKIKDAINSVSDTRGNMGALQNRLDHTINNLGVMRENIQNAESSIRDTDVAEEMMTYTKNSILNQSAQAMLAQANQLPQGVLQLLG